MPRLVTFFEQKIVAFQPKHWENWVALLSISLTDFAKEFENSPNFQYHKFEDKNSGQDPTWLLQNLFLFLLDRSNKPEWCKWWQQGGMEMWNQPNELGRDLGSSEQSQPPQKKV